MSLQNISRNFLFSRFFRPSWVARLGERKKRLKCADRLNQSKFISFKHLDSRLSFRMRMQETSNLLIIRLCLVALHAQLEDEKNATFSRIDLENKTSDNKVYDSKFRPHSQSALQSAVVCWFCTRTSDSARIWRKMNFYLFLALKELLFARKVCSARKLSLRHPKIGSETDSGQHFCNWADDSDAVHPCLVFIYKSAMIKISFSRLMI